MYKATKQVKHLQSVMEHINLVRLFCSTLNDRLDNDIFGRISDEEIKNHDASKFSEIEITGYVKQFYTDDKNSQEWQTALKHHYQNNPHHWQYWLDDINGTMCEGLSTPLVMPSEQVLIMVADWLAAGYQYKGSADISTWLNDNLLTKKINLHKDTALLLNQVLEAIGFGIKVPSGEYSLRDKNLISKFKWLKAF